MNVTQMHLAIQQGVDKINSLQADLLLGEEIDIELNKNMSRFLNTKYGKNNKYGKGFEESQKRIDDLRSLVKEYSAPVIFKERYDNNYWIDQFKLPSDYLYLVNQRSEIFVDNCDPIEYSLDDTNPTAYVVIPLNNLHNATSIISSLDLIADPSNSLLGSAPLSTLTFSTYTYPQNIQQLKDDLIDPLNWGSGFEIYWEQYGQLDYPNSLIVIVDISVWDWFNWDSSDPVNTNTSLISSVIGQFTGGTGLEDDNNTIAYGEYVEDGLGAKRLPPLGSTREYALNKFIQQDDIFKLLDDPFNTTKYTSPLTTIRGEYIDIYTSDIFIIDKVKITYIRKPQQISLSLGISCELPEHTHQEIVDMVVSSILEGISDPRYKTHQLEVSKNE
tara:strand:+ start:798 stop:1958 length:1161 start_codon:yes stop_codon:yes gene_type:complete